MWPSGSARAAATLPITPAPPARLSDHDRLLELARGALRDQPRHHVDRPAGRIGHDDGDGAEREGADRGRAGGDGKPRKRAAAGEHVGLSRGTGSPWRAAAPRAVVHEVSAGRHALAQRFHHGDVFPERAGCALTACLRLAGVHVGEVRKIFCFMAARLSYMGRQFQFGRKNQAMHWSSRVEPRKLRSRSGSTASSFKNCAIRTSRPLQPIRKDFLIRFDRYR